MPDVTDAYIHMYNLVSFLWLLLFWCDVSRNDFYRILYCYYIIVQWSCSISLDSATL